MFLFLTHVVTSTAVSGRLWSRGEAGGTSGSHQDPALQGAGLGDPPTVQFCSPRSPSLIIAAP